MAVVHAAAGARHDTAALCHAWPLRCLTDSPWVAILSIDISSWVRSGTDMWTDPEKQRRGGEILVTSPKVIYSIDARLGGGGIGNVAQRAAEGIYRAGALTRLFVSSNAQDDIPTSKMQHLGILGRALKLLAAKDTTGLVYHLESSLFDAWVAAHQLRGNIFHGWNGMCLWSLRQARRHGMITIVERASSHPATQVALLREEYARWTAGVGPIDHGTAPAAPPTAAAEGEKDAIPGHPSASGPKLVSSTATLPNGHAGALSWNHERLIAEIEEADYVAIPSDFVRESMLNAGAPPGKLIQIPFGVDVKKFSPGQPPASSPTRVLFVGQIALRKGIPYLLEAWRSLAWKGAELWLAGAIAADFQAIRDRWAGLAGVRFLGHTPDVSALMRQCHLFVFPSIEEGSALVTYEAMACGLPIITTPNAGSVVREGQEGFIVPIRDVGALRERMQRLTEDRRLRVDMGRAGRLRAEQFTWDEYARKLISAYYLIAGDGTIRKTGPTSGGGGRSA
jgi:hypothetical protein